MRATLQVRTPVVFEPQLVFHKAADCSFLPGRCRAVHTTDTKPSWFPPMLHTAASCAPIQTISLQTISLHYLTDASASDAFSMLGSRALIQAEKSSGMCPEWSQPWLMLSVAHIGLGEDPSVAIAAGLLCATEG